MHYERKKTRTKSHSVGAFPNGTPWYWNILFYNRPRRRAMRRASSTYIVVTTPTPLAGISGTAAHTHGCARGYGDPLAALFDRPGGADRPARSRPLLGSGPSDQSQKMTVAASAMAENKACGHRS
mgnify:CR=1 FL=1